MRKISSFASLTGGSDKDSTMQPLEAVAVKTGELAVAGPGGDPGTGLVPGSQVEVDPWINEEALAGWPKTGDIRWGGSVCM